MSAKPFGVSGPIHVVMNAGSGHDDATILRETIVSVLGELGRAHEVMLIEKGASIVDVARRAVTKARASDGIVVAAGGDGTINAVAQAVLGSGCTFGVIPQGTFNYFARAHAIPQDTAEATRVVASGRVLPVQVGDINGRVFLVNASLGLYPRLLEDREKFKAEYGRSRLVAFYAGLSSLLRDHRHMSITVERGGVERTLRTLTLFVGNNDLQLERVGVEDGLGPGALGAIVLKPVTRPRMIGLVLRGAMGKLGAADEVETFAFRRMTVTPRSSIGRRHFKVATDGEVVVMRAPFEIRVLPDALRLIVPEERAAN